MAAFDGNFQFLLKCKAYSSEGRLKQLIIPDKHISSSSLLSQEQILVSQYISALHDDIINPSHLKSSHRYSLPVTFALVSKALRLGNLELVDRIISSSLKEISNNLKNKHIMMYNKVKILLLQSQFKKATFYCEQLLKEAGDGSDYYTYQFLNLLVKQDRTMEAFKIAERHLESKNGHQKHKIQSIYLYFLKSVLQKDEAKAYKKIQQFFNNKLICIRNWFNIGLLLKQKCPQKSLQIFKAVRQKSPHAKLQVLAIINIIQIYQQSYLKRCDKIDKYKLKQIREQCETLYAWLEQKIDFSQLFLNNRNKNQQLLDKLRYDLKNQSNLNFFQSITQKINSNKAEAPIQSEELLSEADAEKQNKMVTANQTKCYQQKRAQNDRRLRFLLKKQKELKKFFQKLKVQKNGSKLKIKILDKSILEKSQERSSCLVDNFQEEMNLQEQRFQEKKKQMKGMYEDNQINEIIHKFIEQWVTPSQKQHVLLKNAQNMKKFVITLECPNSEEKTPYESITNRSIQKSDRTSHQAFRVKNNTSRKASEKMLQGLKNNDYISNQIIHNLKNNIAERKKEQERQSNYKKSFKQLLHQGEIFQQQNKLEEAHEHYAQMYKRFKQKRQKEILLLKIAENFEKLSFFAEAEKTYTKCTKFDNTQAFFKLGSLQIRTGKVQSGIQNLQKANCYDRNNLKIEIQLVYAYSLLEETTDRALALANSILKYNPQCMEALIMSSKILQKKGKLKQALQIALAIASSVKTASTFHYIGLLYLNDSNVSEAFKYFHKAIEHEPDHHPSLIQLATIISQTKPQEAIQILKNVLSADPRNQLAFARLGKIYESFENDYENALIIYKKGLEYLPSYENYVKIGDCQFKLGLVVDAHLSYKEALAIKVTAEIHQKIGEVYEHQHQDKKAIESYVSALAQLPKQNTNAMYTQKRKYLYKLGKLSILSQDYEAAYGYLSQVADMGQNFQIFKLLGQACYGKGDYVEALNYYEQATTMCSEDNLELLECIAMCFDKQEQYLTSKEIYQKILTLDPKNIKCLNNLANILLIMGKTNQAFYWFEFMLQQAPNNLEKRLRVADIYATIGDWSKVEQHLTICYKQKQNDIRVIERMVNLYKEKRDTKQLNKFEKRLGLLKTNIAKNS